MYTTLAYYNNYMFVNLRLVTVMKLYFRFLGMDQIQRTETSLMDSRNILWDRRLLQHCQKTYGKGQDLLELLPHLNRRLLALLMTCIFERL